MQRRDFLTAAAAVGLSTATGTSRGDVLIPKRNAGSETTHSSRYNPERSRQRRVPSENQRYVLLEIYSTQSVAKRNELLRSFDSRLINDRNQLGFDKVGVFYVDTELMRGDRSYNAALYDAAVFVVQESSNIENFLDLQRRTADNFSRFNLSDDLEFIDEEMTVLRSLVCQPRIEVPYRGRDRLLQLRTYNSPNYERNIAKARMFEQGELDLFRRCGMEPVFMGSAIFGSWIPNITYMLSFENDEARREGWDMFVRHPEWRQMSGDPQYARTATRIRNLFLRPSNGSQI
ncbi:MAG: NIPSNAP family protein [Thermoguttaceae bacterium]|nr:NIPSNAP family protein [Thermoguttaceae bacterium]